ncbi:hypothetical protein TMEC54S_02526 [Thauera mechernichensis]
MRALALRLDCSQSGFRFEPLEFRFACYRLATGPALAPTMRLTRSARSLAAWIAMFAMLLAALAPTLSQAAYRASGDARWLEICTAAGMRYVAVNTAPQDPADELARTAGGCVFCSLFASALPAAWGGADVPSAQGEDISPAFSLHPPRPRPPWVVSSPRAPPAVA